MTQWRAGKFIVAAICVGALAACGGGGGGAPPGTDPPAAAASANAAAAGNTSSSGNGSASTGANATGADSSGAASNAAPGMPAAASAATFSNTTLDPPATDDTGSQSSITIDPTNNTFKVSVIAGGVSYTHSFSGSDAIDSPLGPDFAAIGDGTANPLDVLLVRILNYSAYGMWEHDNDATGSSGMVGSFATGTPTPPTALPPPGSVNATYSGQAIGTLSAGGQSYLVAGLSTLTADFTARTVTGQMAMETFLNSGGVWNVNPWTTISVNSGILPGSSHFTGTASAAAATGAVVTPAMSGPVSGNFYGPKANEIAGIFNVAGPGAAALGTFGGSEQTILPSGSFTNVNLPLVSNPAVSPTSTLPKFTVPLPPGGMVSGKIQFPTGSIAGNFVGPATSGTPSGVYAVGSPAGGFTAAPMAGGIH